MKARKSQPLTLIIEHTVETLAGLPVPRRIELLEALLALAGTPAESALLKRQLEALQIAERDQAQLLLDLHAQRIRRAA